MIRKLWASLHPNPVPQPDEPTVRGGDPAPNYRWRTQQYNEGDFYVTLEQWTQKYGWMNRGTKMVGVKKDWKIEVPAAKSKLWVAEQERAEIERNNAKWAEQNL